ncbi:gastric triacylglycerol lipase-like [Dermacentor albipictus]|uniref:gastric triacylglycerol lipase-like n=1 Tax=Dermacentor albipictus TaxID=60249 RepID=UPI0038FC2013
MYLGHYPIGTTIQDLLHFYQVNIARDFVMYDHGAKENLKRYNQATPPAYPLERITTPWALFSSEGDQIADCRDVEELVARLGSRVILHRVVPQKTFGHLDFAIGYKCTDFLHNVAIDVVKQQIGQSE